MRKMLFLAGILLSCSSAKSDGGSTATPSAGDVESAACFPSTTGLDLTNAKARFPKLTAFCLFETTSGGASLQPIKDAIPYELNTPLFSDYTTKERFFRLPPGEAIDYADTGPLSFPIGTILVKTFSYGGGADGLPLRRIETRLLIHTAEGWIGLPYVWNDAQTEATLRLGGEVKNLSWALDDGRVIDATYLVPNGNQCKKCHEQDSVLSPLGPTARNLHRDGTGSSTDQLQAWAARGALRGLPDLATVKRLPAWNDPSSGTVSERARAWLDANCSHCHSKVGTASTSALYLGFDEPLGEHLGICKPPVAAGKGTGGRQFDVVPGSPDASIFVYRLEATIPDEAMPELGRSVVSGEGVALVREWITGLTGSCNQN